jgi:hypothetical protein
MNKRQTLLILMVLLALVVGSQASFAQGNSNKNKNKNTNTNTSQNNNGNSGNNGGNADCPAGTTEVAKFNWGGGWVLESGGGVTINGSAADGTWSSTVYIKAIVVKGGNGNYIVTLNPTAMSGTYTSFGLPLVGNGNTPGISNIKFCAGEQPPPPPPTNGDCLVGGQITPYLNIDFSNPLHTYYDQPNLKVSYKIVNSSSTNSYMVGVASYKVYSSTGGVPDITNQTLYRSDVQTVGPNSSVVVSVNVPSCAFQVDVFCGPVITNFASEGLYGNRKLSGQGFAGAWYGPNPEGSWSSNLCQ